MKNVILLLFAASLLWGCRKENENVSADPTDENQVNAPLLSWWQPKAGATIDWCLDDLKTSDTFTAEVVDVDAFTTTAAQVAALHQQGKK